MEEITITISGKSCSGKSTILYLFKEFLKHHDFDTEFDGSSDFYNEKQFDSVLQNDIRNKTEIVRKKTKIVFKEQNIYNIK